MEQVEEICDQIILVNKGQKVLDGTVSGVRQQFKENLFHIGLHQSPDNLQSNGFDIQKKEEDGLVVKIKDGHSTNDLLQHFINQGVSIKEFHEILPSLNEIFIKLVEGTPATRQFQSIEQTA
jgi:ABC-2 type transport system ATP-binding protein